MRHPAPPPPAPAPPTSRRPGTDHGGARSRPPSTVVPSRPVLVTALLVAAFPLVTGTAPAEAQERTVEAAREHQQRFERFRQSRIPVDPREEVGCDERIGRICIWFGGEDEEDFPAEPVETEQARRGLIGVLLETREQVRDPWVLGQLVHYLVEQRDFAYAERVAEECGIEESWWCDALLGYSRHVRGAWVEAGEAFQDALAGMPAEERRRWTALRPLVSDDDLEALDDLAAGAREAREELFWRLSDPLLLVEGNDRLTDHFARLVLARNRQDAENPQGLLWDDDLEETLVRYGRMLGWSRTHDPRSPMAGGRFQLQDTRSVHGHHHPRSRGYLFPGEFLASPSEIPPESWLTAPRAARTWYAPPYAPDFQGLETQVGRFRRGAEMLVVAAYRPAPRDTLLDSSRPARPTDLAVRRDRDADRREGGGADPFGGGRPGGGDPLGPELDGPVRAGLFLVPVDGGPAVETTGIRAEDVLTLRAEPGAYVSSLELLAPEDERAWRARQGVRQAALFPGQVSVSDLLVLREGAALPEDLEDAIPDVRPGVRVGLGERFVVVWEAYGLQVDQPVGVTLGFTRGRPGFLQRVGEFLGVVEPEEPVEITFADAATEQVQSAFRAVRIQLPELEPGAYTLHLRLDLPEGEPVVTSRPIVVEG